jgi:hypothetical protein
VAVSALDSGAAAAACTACMAPACGLLVAESFSTWAAHMVLEGQELLVKVLRWIPFLGGGGGSLLLLLPVGEVHTVHR